MYVHVHVHVSDIDAVHVPVHVRTVDTVSLRETHSLIALAFAINALHDC